MAYLAFAPNGSNVAANFRMQQTTPRVDKIELVQYWGGRQIALQDNPNSGGATPGGGKRVFPDRLTPTDHEWDARRTVWAKVTLTPKRAGIDPLSIWAYDVDDPSSNQAPVDNETQAFDNRSPFAPEPRWQRLTQWAPSDANGVVWAELKVSMQPGDNYRVVASMFLEEQHGFHAKHPDPEGRVFDANNQVVTTMNHPNVRVSDLLTVWRRVHVERDHMAAPPRGERFTARGAGDSSDVGIDDVRPPVPHPDPSISLMQAEYTRAYISVVDDLGDLNKVRVVPWDHNIEKAEVWLKDRWRKDVESKQDYWVLLIVGAYEGIEGEDNDPNIAEDRVNYGITAANGDEADPEGDGPSYIYLETIADFCYWEPLLNPTQTVADEGTLIRRTVLHESMHHFKGLKAHSEPPAPLGPADFGPMSQSNNAYGTDAQNKITQTQLHLMRSDPLPG